MGNYCCSAVALRKIEPVEEEPVEEVRRSGDGTPRVSVLRGQAIQVRVSGDDGPVSPRMSVLRGQPQLSIQDKYVLKGELGRGNFGVTYLCSHKETGESLACKSIPKIKLEKAIDIEDVRREVAIMNHLANNPSIASLKEAWEDEKAVHLVMELCEGGELFDRITARRRYPERAAAKVMRSIVKTIQVFHKHGIIHRDIKPENFLFLNKNENSPLKAIDFGLSVFYKPGDRFSEIVGSPFYMAPEVLKGDYGPEIDVWGAGVILYILLCGGLPFWDESDKGVFKAILRGNVDLVRKPWPQISEDAKNLVRGMLEPDPKRRLTAQQVLEHRWLIKCCKML